MIKRLIFSLALLLAPGPVLAGTPASFDDLAWLEGAWVGDGLMGMEAGETWSPPAGGQMVGHFYQLLPTGEVMFYELMTIVSDNDGGLVMRLKHFAPDLAGWEVQDSAAAEEFALTEIGDEQFDFSGLVYALQADGSLKITLTVANSDGSPQEVEFRFRRREG